MSTLLAWALLLFLLAVWLAQLRPHPRALPMPPAASVEAKSPRGWGLSFSCGKPGSRVTIVGMIKTGLLAFVCVAVIFGALFGSDENPEDYPDCFEIVRYLGTDPDAKCNDRGEVITVKTDSAWKHFHPGQ